MDAVLRMLDVATITGARPGEIANFPVNAIFKRETTSLTPFRELHARDVFASEDAFLNL